MTRPSNGDKASISRRQALALLGSAPFLSLQSSCSSKESNKPPSQTSGPTEPIEYSSLRDVARRVQTKEISPVELTTRMLDRIAAVDPNLKSYATVMRERRWRRRSARKKRLNAEPIEVLCTECLSQ